MQITEMGRYHCANTDTVEVYHNKQAVVRGTTNPTPCCELANATDLFPLSYGR